MTYLYDQHGDLIEEHSSEGDVSQYAYDGKGRLQRFTDPLGITTDYVTDPFKHVIAIIRAAGTENEVTESLEYGAHDLPIAMTDGRGNTTRLALDDFGHRLWRETPDGGNVLYQYNAFGLVAAKVDETGVVTRYDCT
jgi:YD repeat-containing protein